MKNYQTKTARILDSIIRMMEIRPDEIEIEEHIERANVATGEKAQLFLRVAPRWKEDFGLLVGGGTTFRAMRQLMTNIAMKEGLELRWKEIEKPNGVAKLRPKASRIEIEDLHALVQKMAGAVFGESQVKVESVADFFSVVIQTKENTPRITEMIFESVINAIAKSRAVQIGVTFAVKPIESQPESAAGRFVGEVER